MKANKSLSIPDIARRLGVSRRTVFNWSAREGLPLVASRHGKGQRVARVGPLRRWLAATGRGGLLARAGHGVELAADLQAVANAAACCKAAIPAISRMEAKKNEAKQAIRNPGGGVDEKAQALALLWEIEEAGRKAVPPLTMAAKLARQVKGY